jgi:hypothetical protein
MLPESTNKLIRAGLSQRANEVVLLLKLEKRRIAEARVIDRARVALRPRGRVGSAAGLPGCAGPPGRLELIVTIASYRTCR